jgi:hypothetical protein
VRATKKQTERTKRRARTKRGRRVKRCRDIFCTAQRLSIDKREGPGLSYRHVEKVMHRIKPRLIPCAIEERRRDPMLRRVQIEFVISVRGRVLATRANGKRRTRMARCMHRQMAELARFPRGIQRQVASFTLTVLN